MYRLYQYRSCWAKGNTCCISIQICHGHITLYMTFLAMILNASRIMVHPQVVVWNAILKAYTCPLNHPLVNQSEQVNTDLSVKVAENLPNQACKMTLIQWFFSYNFLDVMIPPKKNWAKNIRERERNHGGKVFTGSRLSWEFLLRQSSRLGMSIRLLSNNKA